jgi:hypothetical protein
VRRRMRDPRRKGGLLRRWRRLRQARRHEQFAALVCDALGELRSAGSYCYDGEEFALIEPSSGTRWPLEEAYERYRHTAARRRADWINAVAQSLLVPPIPAELDAARGGLVPALISRAAHELARLAGPGSWPAAVPVCDGLVAAVYYQGERQRHPCTAAQLDAWGLDPEQALALAVQNLAERPGARLIEGPAGTFRSSPEHGDGASLFCVESLIRSARVRGRPVAMVPGCGLLLLTGSEDAQGLAALADLALHATRGTRPLSGTAYVLGPAGWSPFQPEDPALRERLRGVALPFELREYAAQKSLLDALLREQRGRVQVVETRCDRDAAGAPHTWCAWTEGTEALLPRTDFIVLARAGAQRGLAVRWETAMRELGTLMEPTTLFPARFRVRGFPPAAPLRALIRAARREPAEPELAI